MRAVLLPLLLLAWAAPLRAQPERGWGDGQLRERLEDPRWPEERERAVAEGRRRGLGEEVWGPLLERMIAEQRPSEARMVCEALEPVAGERSLPRLARLLRAPNFGTSQGLPVSWFVRAAWEHAVRESDPAAVDSALIAASPPGDGAALARLEAASRERPDDPLVDLSLLVRATQASDPVVRRRAARLLARRGPRLLPLLTRALRGRNELVLEALAEQEREEIAPTLLPLLRGGERAGEPAALALARLGPRVKPLLAVHPQSMWKVLCEVDPLALADELASSDGERRRRAALALGMRPTPAALPALRRALSAGRNDSLYVIQALAALGPEAAPAAPELVQVLRAGPGDLVRREAAEALAAIGSAAQGAGLGADWLGAPEFGVRCAAARALSTVDPQADPQAAAQVLLSAFRLGQTHWTSAALEGLRCLGPDAACVTTELLTVAAGARPASEGAQPITRERVLEALRAQGEAAVPGALAALGDPDPDRRQVAAALLGQLAAELTWPEPAVRGLESRLSDERPEVREAALAGLDAFAGRMSWTVAEQPALVAAVESARSGVRAASGLQLLAQLGPTGSEALARAVRDAPRHERGPALLALARATRPARILPFLSEQLQDPNNAAREVGCQVISALAAELPVGFLVEVALREPTRIDLRPVAGQALPLLAEFASTTVRSPERRQAYLAMIRLGTPGVLAVLERVAEAEDGREMRDAWSALHSTRAELNPGLIAAALMRTRVRERALPMLQLLGAAPVDDDVVLAVAVLESLARTEPDPNVSLTAAQVLGRMGPVACPALARLLRQAQGGDGLYEAATQALRAQSLVAPDLLLDLLADTAPAARAAGYDNLAEVAARTPWADLAVPAVVAGLDDVDPLVRESCIRGLGRLRVGADHADRLAALTRDPDPQVQLAAAQQLANLGPVNEAAAAALRACLGDAVLGPVVARSLRGNRSGQEILRQALAGDDVAVRLRAAEVMGAEGASAAAALLEGPPEQRREALEVLERLGRAAGDQGGAILRVMLTDEDETLRLMAASALGASRPAAELQPGIVRGFQDKSPAVRAATAQVLALSLARSGECSDEVLQGILAASRDPETDVRQAVLGVLSRLRQRDQVQEELRRIYVQDPDPSLREAARRMLPRPR